MFVLFVHTHALMIIPLPCIKKETIHFINIRFSYCSTSQRECFFYFYRSHFASCTKQNNSSFNYVNTNSNSLLFAFFSINFNAFLIPTHWLVNQPLQLLLPYNAFQSFLKNPDFKMAYHYLYKLLEMDSLPELLGPAAL